MSGRCGRLWYGLFRNLEESFFDTSENARNKEEN